MNRKILSLICILSAFLCGCSSASGSENVSYSDEAASDESGSEITEYTEEQEPEQEQGYVPSESDFAVAEWFSDYITDEEEFPDKKDYQYYARALGLDKDFFLSADMWECFYNADTVNINRDIDEREIYLIRLDPYKLLDIYAENNGCTADDICAELSVTKEQLYYNWGYNPVWIDYFNKHKNKEAAFSEKEERIFGKYNGEDRHKVMSTHMIVIDNSNNKKKKYIQYSDELFETLEISRRDRLFAFSDLKKSGLYSLYSDNEKNASYKVNGIGIRAVIPLAMPNASADADLNSVADINISVMVNVSPYAYGCTDDDKLDLAALISAREEQQDKKK